TDAPHPAMTIGRGGPTTKFGRARCTLAQARRSIGQGAGGVAGAGGRRLSTSALSGACHFLARPRCSVIGDARRSAGTWIRNLTFPDVLSRGGQALAALSGSVGARLAARALLYGTAAALVAAPHQLARAGRAGVAHARRSARAGRNDALTDARRWIGLPALTDLPCRVRAWGTARTVLVRATAACVGSGDRVAGARLAIIRQAGRVAWTARRHFAFTETREWVGGLAFADVARRVCAGLSARGFRRRLAFARGQRRGVARPALSGVAGRIGARIAARAGLTDVVDALRAHHGLAAGRTDGSVSGGTRVRAATAYAGWARTVGSARGTARTDVGGSAARIACLARIEVPVAADELVGRCAEDPLFLEYDGAPPELILDHGVLDRKGDRAAHRVADKMPGRRAGRPPPRAPRRED